MTLPAYIDTKKTTAAAWFRALRDRICAGLEAIEAEVTGPNAHMPAGKFERTPAP